MGGLSKKKHNTFTAMRVSLDADLMCGIVDGLHMVPSVVKIPTGKIRHLVLRVTC